MAKHRSTKQKYQPRNHIYITIVLLCSVILLSFAFLYNNQASAEPYPIKGFDVSHHQGKINWKKISPQQYQFVYLKATEGGDYQDDLFQTYWLEAHERGMRVGAYHFFRLCREGEIQAKNFIRTVPKSSTNLPPVMDLEYDANCINTFTREQLLKQIKIMHDRLQQHYAQQPIFYTSKSFYNIVLTGEFQDTPIWIREYKDSPELKDGRKWTFWQQSNRGQIQGISKPVDLNVFYGDAEQWKNFLDHSSTVTQKQESE